LTAFYGDEKHIMPPKIAVVNHDAHILYMMEKNLKVRGFDVQSFHEHVDQVNTLEEIKPDLVILGNVKHFNDNEMRLIYQMRKSESLARTPVIIATTDVHLRTQNLDEFTHTYVLMKPFAVETLLESIRRALVSVSKI
jgi:DNA-binding response OmpR family regulator